MAVASELPLPPPLPFLEPDLLPLDPPHDSDDDYGYVASLAEQIAHAMLDDDDPQEPLFSQPQLLLHPSPFPSLPVASFRSQATAHDIWHPTSKINSSSHAWKAANLLSTPLSGPVSCARSPTQNLACNRGYGNKCITHATTPLEHAVHDNQASARHRRAWECISYSKKSEAAVLVMSPATPAVVEGFLIPSASAAASSFDSPAINRDTAASPQQPHKRHDYGSLDLQRRGRPSGGRIRHGGYRGYEMVGRSGPSASARLYAYYLPRKSLPHEATVNVGVGSVFLGYGGARKETTGTGVFLPRPMATGVHHRRKPELAREVTKVP